MPCFKTVLCTDMAVSGIGGHLGPQTESSGTAVGGGENGVLLDECILVLRRKPFVCDCRELTQMGKTLASLGLSRKG